MNQSFYHKLCITNILNGVKEGLSKFSHPSKVALIFAAGEDDSVSVFDPQNILRWHESKLKEFFFDNQDEWRQGIKEKISGQPQGYMVSEKDIALSGLISYGGSCKDFFTRCGLRITTLIYAPSTLRKGGWNRRPVFWFMIIIQERQP